MKRFLIFACLAALIPGAEAFAAGGFPFLHTRPKPVLLDDQPSTPEPAQNRTAHRAPVVYPSLGRTTPAGSGASPGGVAASGGAGASKDRRYPEAHPAKSSLSDIFTRAWHFGEPSTSKPSAQTK